MPWRRTPAPWRRPSRSGTASASGTPRESDSASWLCPRYDLRKIVRLERGPAHQRAVDVGLREQVGRVVRLDRSAVLDADRIRHLCAAQLAQEPADLAVHLLRLRGGGHLAGADGPHRLVGAGAAADLLAGEAREGAADLPGDHLPGAVSLPLLQRLAHADDGVELRLEDGLQLAVHALVRLAEVLAALAVAEDHSVAAQLLEHGRADLAGEGALLLVVAVLGEELDGAAHQRLLHLGERREGRRHRHLDLRVQPLPQLPHQGRLLSRGLVHLPIATHELPSRHDDSNLPRSGYSSRTLMPGRSRPSRYSREAPPPVETWVTLEARPISAMAAAESPPPTMVRAPVPVASASASATARVPAANSATSNIPIGPFQNTVFAPRMRWRYSSRALGPMSRPSIPSGICATVCVGMPPLGSFATTWSAGNSTSTRDCAALSRMRFPPSPLSFPPLDAPTGSPRAVRKGEPMSPPMRSASTLPIS